LSHFDQSWCARINAHKRREPEAAPAPAPAAAPSPFKLREIPREHVCECCGTVMYDHNCKIVCPNCGYKRDCSDP
jgi:rubrerythrin